VLSRGHEVASPARGLQCLPLALREGLEPLLAGGRADERAVDGPDDAVELVGDRARRDLAGPLADNQFGECVRALDVQFLGAEDRLHRVAELFL